MRCHVVLFCALIFALGVSAFENKEWKEYKQRFNKSYATVTEQLARLEIWKKNAEFVRSHNRLYNLGRKSYNVGMNQFADLTPEEFAAKFKTGYHLRRNAQESGEAKKSFEDPASVDWRTKCGPRPVRDQGQCGDAAIFTSVDVLDCVFFNEHNGTIVDLSVDQLTKCMNGACNGGFPDAAYEYIKDHGITTEDCWQRLQSCSMNQDCVNVYVKKVNSYTGGDETVLRHQVVSGPVTVAIDASHQGFQLYISGIYDEPACSSTQLDHDLVLEGYGTQQKTDYWIAKNSWGTSWGMEGYILMSRGKKNQCGIASDVIWPTI